MERQRVTRMGRLVRSLWPLRWLRSALELLHGARVHPACQLIGGSGIRLGRRAVVGARSRLVLVNSGTIILESGTWLSSDVDVETDACISIGSGTTVQRRCSLNGSVRIGRGCLLAPNVFISSRTHPFRSFPHLLIREQERILRASPAGGGEPDRPVWIQDDCWLGVNAVISPGVTVGKGSVIGASAVVTHDVAPYSVVAGIPARCMGTRLAWNPPLRIDLSRDEDLVYIIEGCIPDGCAGEARRVAVTADRPLLAAFSPLARAITVHYRANRETEVEVGGRRMTVSEGESSFVVPTVGLSARFDALMFELALARRPTGALLELSLLESADIVAGPA